MNENSEIMKTLTTRDKNSEFCAQEPGKNFENVLKIVESLNFF